MIEESNPGTPRNIVVFGQTGAGKSSLINMLAGSAVAKAGNGAGGCTTSNEPYDIPHGNGVNGPSDSYTFWDTAGLNEGQEGNVPKDALPNLLKIVTEHGVNLVIYCIRGRLGDIVRINYDLFWGIICSKGVPIVLVVTGLEAEQDMDKWWKTNQKSVKKMGMSFRGYACVTTSRGRRDAYKKEYEESAQKVWKLVREHCGSQSWHMPPECSTGAQKRMEEYMTLYNRGRKGWWKFIPESIRRLFVRDQNHPVGDKPSAHLNDNIIAKHEPGSIQHNVIIFGETGSGKSSLVNMIVGKKVARTSNGAGGCTLKDQHYKADIDNTTFRIYDTTGLNQEERGRVPHWVAIESLYTLIRRLDGLSLLIYCTRCKVNEMTEANWTLFNKVICGGKVPIIAVVTGLDQEDDPDDWWRRKDNRETFRKHHIEPRATGCIVSSRGQRNEYADVYAKSQDKLRRLIKDNHLQQPWREEKANWFANIYQSVYSTGLLSFPRNRLEYSATIRILIAEYVKKKGLKEEDPAKLEAIILEEMQRAK